MKWAAFALLAYIAISLAHAAGAVGGRKPAADDWLLFAAIALIGAAGWVAAR